MHQVPSRNRFWQKHASDQLCPEQVMILHHMLDTDDVHCLQSISAGQYQAIAQVSKATATGHLSDLIEKKRFEKISAGGRSTRYRLLLTNIL